MALSQRSLDAYRTTSVSTVETVIVPYDSFKNAWRRTVWGDDHVVLVVTEPYGTVETAEARVDTDLPDAGVGVIDPLDLVGSEWKADPHNVVHYQDEYPPEEPAFWREYWALIRECIRDETFVIERGRCDGLSEFEAMTPHRVEVRVED
ncbi:hypothetical protein [Natrinema versiforme]|uniref:Uncharacterized protein n=1 Tax=Natrinema versiforme TaxID=88724 RepID=A0A4P8WK01_9EURY|nr:hypothetical protein [Natrinema versiforme]QCS43634.1 hypothetical protein FEJ81_15215 [Natrinema versiforme]